MRRFESEGAIWTSKIIGANFCHVETRSPIERSRPWRTSGSQMCIGARPSFRVRAIIAIVLGYTWVVCLISHSPVNQALVQVAKSSRAAPVT